MDGAQFNQSVDHDGFARQGFDQRSWLGFHRSQNIQVPNREKPPLQPGIGVDARRDLRQARLHPSSDEAEDVGERDDVADIVSELHRSRAIVGLAGGINDHGESAIQIGCDAFFFGEGVLRGERAEFALQLDGDSLPGAKMAGFLFRRRGGRQMEKSL